METAMRQGSARRVTLSRSTDLRPPMQHRLSSARTHRPANARPPTTTEDRKDNPP